MAIGLRTRNPDGSIRLDLTTRIAKVLGSFETGTSNGSRTVSIPIEGTVFWVQVLTNDGGINAKRAAVVYQGNGSFSWAFSFQSGVGNYAANSRVFYGVH